LNRGVMVLLVCCCCLLWACGQRPLRCPSAADSALALSMVKRRQTEGSSPRPVRLSSSARSQYLGGAFENRQRMLVTFAVDANGGDQCQLIADMQPIDLDREQIEPRQIRRHPCGHPFCRQLDEPARDGRLGPAVAQFCGNVALRQPNRATEPAGRDLKC